MAELPSGTVTFLFTDLEVSTRLWEREPDAMRAALARHDELLRAAVESQDGVIVKGRGDGVHAVFATADGAVRAAVDCELAMDNEAWAVSEPLRARIGIHTGVAELRDGDYFGSAVNRAARLEGIGHGGQILCSQATADLARDVLARGIVFEDLGEHRLRDLSRPERVFRVSAPGLPADFAPLRSLDAFPGNLPVRASSFVGRDRDMARVAKALTDFPVVTLTGVGGVGKTRLALQVAADALPGFPDGAWMCELASVRDPDAVVEALAGVFLVTARPGSTLLESLVAYLRDQELLVLLDNCEHLLRPAATLAAAIVAGCPHVRILATSREGLNIEGEQILVVPSLAVPDDKADVATLNEYEAVRLFVERARAVKADFVVDGANAAGVAQVCRRLDGVPLAIELAAARVNAMNPAELAQRLDRRFRLLSGGDRVAIERHQTLQATIDWSYDLLSAGEQRVLVRLSVFAGGCTLDAAEAVCAGEAVDTDDVLDLLARLVAHHLVVADDSGEQTRYRLLETIRQYGEERLAELDETDVIRARHCDHYTVFAAQVRDHSDGPGQIEWGARLAREHDNLFAAMAFALETVDLDRAMGLLCAVPFPILQVDDLVIFDAAPVLDLPGALDHPGSAAALMSAAFRGWDSQDGARVLALCDQAQAAEERLGRLPGTHVALWSSGLRANIARAAGDVPGAVELHRAAARLAESQGLAAGVAAQRAMAGSALAGSDPAAALAEGREAVALARRAGQPQALATCLLMLATSAAVDEPDLARALLAEAQDLAAAGGGHESPSALQGTLLAAAQLGDWPIVLHAATRVLHHRLRTGVGANDNAIVGALNLAARGLAEPEPEAAAVMQGAAAAAARPLMGRAIGMSPTGTGGGDGLTFVIDLRRDATRIITAAIGDQRLRELRAQGEAMEPDAALAYARAEIDAYLARMGA